MELCTADDIHEMSLDLDEILLGAEWVWARVAESGFYMTI
jgi:hypothetical protein